ncbi:hypothetical protein NQ314_011227 [Rhamnusium bicolor]|uniref:PiggyBac transposable element-derived protein domain-containing protein n=1 Tax=Rhamnusium bicolor TaxID=1586634 RepID=A0AAV8XKJ8_9CUCU|nr:hypothetical protein NQ314_011227 [Rhamnusium bicolor]
MSIYTGQENHERNRLDSEEDLGSSANIVVRLLRNIPSNKNYKVYFDNYYTTVPLLSQLAKRGIYSLGTIRRNRIPNCTAPVDKAPQKLGRGTCYEYVTEMDGVPISYVIWKDNKIVSLLLAFCGAQPITKVKRV